MIFLLIKFFYSILTKVIITLNKRQNKLLTHCYISLSANIEITEAIEKLVGIKVTCLATSHREHLGDHQRCTHENWSRQL